MPRNASCRDCPLSNGVTTVCIWGSSIPVTGSTSRIVVVGEAPGEREDRLGIPFVGASGELLDDALAQVGVRDYYKTNLVKCRPPGNRTPVPLELNACRPYLDEEIATVKPKAILAVGASAWKRLGGVGSVTEQAGKEIVSSKYNCPVMPVLHPAAILRNRNLEREWRLTLARFAHLANGTLMAKPPVKVLSDIHHKAKPYALPYKLIAAGDFTYDFETNGKDWWDRDFVATTVAFSWDGKRAVSVPLWHPDSDIDPGWRDEFLKAMIPVLVNPEIHKTAHNMLFDDLVWYRLTGVLPYTTLDTLVAWHLLNENSPKGLKYLGRILLGWPDWGILGKGRTPSLPELLEYNGQDACATWLIRQEILARLDEDRRLKIYLARHLMPGMRALANVIVRGIYTDPTHLWKLQRELGAEIDSAAARIPVENPGSTQQLAKWLYEDQGLPILGRTDKGAPSTDEETINTLAEQGYPQANVILDYRRPRKNLTTYVTPILADRTVSYDGRIHPDYHIGPETGRLGSRFHTVPRDARLRAMYSAPPGRVLLSADLRQVEARLVAWYASGCPQSFDQPRKRFGNLLEMFLAGTDVYVTFAGRVLGKPTGSVTKDERQVMGKVPVLAQLYNISAKGLQEYAWRKFQIRWSLAEAVSIWHTFRRTFPEIPAWHAREGMVLAQRGWTQSQIGRKRRLPEAQGWGTEQHEAINAGINMPIQSLAWDITWAGLQAAEDCAFASLHPQVGTVHDSLLAEVEDVSSRIRGAAACLKFHLLVDSLARLRPLGLTLPDGLLDVEFAVGPWGSRETPEDYVRCRWPTCST